VSKYIISLENISKKYVIQTSNIRKRHTLKDYVQDNLNRGLSVIGGKVGLAENKPVKLKDTHAFWALQNITFDVEPGESIGIIGANGAGKSTLLKIISRITSPTTGRMRIRGRVGSLLEVGTGFHADLTGRENVYLNGAILGMRRKEINQKFDEIVAFSEVEEFLDTQVKYYSSGMKMRLAFSVAAHLDPEIMLVDEVLAVGDIVFQRKSLNKMSNVISDGRTVLFVSHNIAAVRALCQKAVFLEKGVIKAIGTVGEVSQAYLNSKMVYKDFYEVSERTQKRSIQILTASILNQSLQPSSSLPHDKPFVIRLKIAVNNAVDHVYISTKIFNQELDTILTTHDFEGDESNLQSRKPGLYYADILIDAPLLPPNQYLLGFSVSRKKGKGVSVVQKVEHIVPFEIFDNGSVLARNDLSSIGFVHTPFKWDYFEINEKG
jgi:lipopolysaccharide transport system ATP-binding protein